VALSVAFPFNGAGWDELCTKSLLSNLPPFIAAPDALVQTLDDHLLLIVVQLSIALVKGPFDVQVRSIPLEARLP
jgi:hypothetical protein